METISACPHHGFDTWMLVNLFYDGMSPAMTTGNHVWRGLSEQEPR